MMRYVIYDQFHWLSPDHLEVVVEGTEEECLEQYRFFADCYPGESLGFVTEDYYSKLKRTFNNKQLKQN